MPFALRFANNLIHLVAQVLAEQLAASLAARWMRDMPQRHASPASCGACVGRPLGAPRPACSSSCSSSPLLPSLPLQLLLSTVLPAGLELLTTAAGSEAGAAQALSSCQRGFCVALATLAFCVPLHLVYWREVRHRAPAAPGKQAAPASLAAPLLQRHECVAAAAGGGWTLPPPAASRRAPPSWTLWSPSPSPCPPWPAPASCAAT